VDPFEPIRVDPDPGEPGNPGRDRPHPVAAEFGTARDRMDPADAAPAIAQTMLLLGAIENRTDAAVAGAAEVLGDPVASTADPLDGPPGSEPVIADGDGCAAAVLAVVSKLAAAGTAAAFVR
jgi:hypothetical protein